MVARGPLKCLGVPVVRADGLLGAVAAVGGMDEAAVFERVVDELDGRGYRSLVHVPAAHADEYASVLDRGREHRISIRGRYPDVVGYTNADEVFAMEVKGARAIQKGLGQALTYQRGVHRSFLAASVDALEEVRDVALAQGLGVVGVEDDGTVSWTPPNQALNRDQLPDVDGQLAYQLRGRESAGRIAGLGLANPLNFLAPVLAVDAARAHEAAGGTGEDGRPSLDAVAAAIESGYEFEATDGAIRGATVLGLLRETEAGVERTDQGDLVAAVLRGSGVRSLSDLAAVKADTYGSTVHRERPVLATQLRNLYRQHPEVRLLLEALAEFDARRVDLRDLLRKLIERYPNVFLNVCCSSRTRERGRRIVERGDADAFLDGDWRDVIRNDLVFNFCHQLRHAGFLAAETTGHGAAIADYDPAEKPWTLNEELLVE